MNSTTLISQLKRDDLSKLNETSSKKSGTDDTSRETMAVIVPKGQQQDLQGTSSSPSSLIGNEEPSSSCGPLYADEETTTD